MPRKSTTLAPKSNSHSESFVFLSYAREDKTHIDTIYLALKEGGLNPWMDKPPPPYQLCGIPPGIDWESEIRRRLQAASLILAFLSSKSVAKEGFIHKEFRLALSYLSQKPQDRIYLIPVLLEPCQPPTYKVDTISLDQLQWYPLYEQGLEPLLEYLRKLSHPSIPDTSNLEMISLRNENELLRAKLDSISNLTDSLAEMLKETIKKKT